MNNKQLKTLLIISIICASFFALRFYYNGHKEKEVLAKYDSHLMKLVGVLNAQNDLANKYDSSIPREEFICIIVLTHREANQTLIELRPELMDYESGQDFLELAEQRMSNIKNIIAPFTSTEDFWKNKCM